MTTTMTPVLIKTYQARTNAEATAMFAHEASVLGNQGYTPSGQTWVGPGMIRLFITPLILVVLGYLVGLLTIGGIYDRRRDRGRLPVHRPPGGHADRHLYPAQVTVPRGT